MPISSLRVGVALAAGLMAACVISPSGAQTVRSEAKEATQSALKYCSEIWSVKDKDEVESRKRSLADSLNERLDDYRKGREELLKGIKAAEQEVERMNEAMATSSMAEALTWEKAETQGVMSAAQIKALGATLWNNTNRAGRDQAEAKLARLKTELSAVQRRMIGWFAFGTIASQCVAEQEKYAANMVDPAYGTPRPPPVNVIPIQSIRATVNGRWNANCVYDRRSYPNDGRFSMVFAGNGTVAAAFVDGVAASVKGQVQQDGAITATGVVNLQGMVVTIVMSGKMQRRNDMSLFGQGTFSSTDGKGIDCKGAWGG